MAKFSLEGVKNVRAYCEEFFADVDKNYDTFASELVEEYHGHCIAEDDKKLLNLVFDKNITQRKFNTFIKNWDIEVEGSHKSLILAYFLSKHPELKCPKYAEPRLKGVIQYFKFYNLKSISHFKRVAKKLKEAGIKVLIMKGGAVRHLRGDFPRAMGDIDILVPEEDYEKAKELAISLGYSYSETPYSVDLHEPDTNINALDLHKKLHMMTEDGSEYAKDLFKRATLTKIYGEPDIYAPSIEDMVFILLINLAKNITQNVYSGSNVHAVWDCEFLVSSKPDFDWEIIKQIAIKNHSQSPVYIATKFIHDFLPDVIPVFFAKEYVEEHPLYILAKTGIYPGLVYM